MENARQTPKGLPGVLDVYYYSAVLASAEWRLM